MRASIFFNRGLLIPAFRYHRQGMRSGFSLLILIFIINAAFGQDRLDLFTLSGNYGFPTAYDSIYEGKGTETGFMASMVAPAVLSEKSVWYSSLNYFYWGVNNDEEMPQDIMNPIRVHGFILRTGLIRELDNGRSFQLIFAPRFMTDFKNVSSDHIQLGGIVTYGKRYSEKLKLGFGALYNHEFFGPNLVPLIDLDWKLNDKWTISGLFPVYGKVKYRFSDRLDGGWSHFGLVTTYRLGDSNYEGDYIDRRSIDETLYARYRLFGDFFLEGRMGYALGRSYTQYDADQKVDFTLPLISIGDDRVAKGASIHDGFIASLRVVYSISLEDK
mgnify:CR=1 FL=1